MILKNKYWLLALLIAGFLAALWFASTYSVHQSIPDDQLRPASTATSYLLQGIVRDQDGSPVENLSIHLADIGPVVDGFDRENQTVYTSEEGAFRFERRRPVKHELSTGVSADFAAEKRIIAAEDEKIELHLVRRDTATISGCVTDDSSQPLQDVRVVPLQLNEEATPTNSLGCYVVKIPVDSNIPEYTVRFLKPGYRDSALIIDFKTLESSGELTRDIHLNALGTVVSLSGVLLDEKDAGVTGEWIYLQSEQIGVQYSAVSSAEGSFSFTGIALAEDYRLWIDPVGPYKDYSVSNLDLLNRLQDSLEIMLEPLYFSAVEGRVINSSGDGIIDLPLNVVSDEARGKSIEIVTGTDGYFYAEAVPTGRITLQSLETATLIQIELAQHETGSAPLEIAVDVGDGQLAGRVEDSQGNPIAGAALRLQGVLETPDTISRIYWDASADEFGEFYFSGLGKGPYDLRVSAKGAGEYSKSVSPGQWVTVSPAPLRQ